METLVSVSLPLPLDVASTLMSAVGSVYPNTSIASSDTHLVFSVPESDRLAPAEGAAVRSPRDENPDWEALLLGIREGTVSLSLPEWFSHLVLSGVVELLSDSGAENYLELPLRDGDGNVFLVTASRSRGQTPHALRMLAEERARSEFERSAALEAERLRLSERVALLEGLLFASGVEVPAP